MGEMGGGIERRPGPRYYATVEATTECWQPAVRCVRSIVDQNLTMSENHYNQG